MITVAKKGAKTSIFQHMILGVLCGQNKPANQKYETTFK